MRESFVFHAEYIQDIPEDLQPVYAMYAINYALKDIEPVLTDWRDVRDWNKVKARIDSDCTQWEETKNARSEAGRRGGLKSGETRAKQNEAKRSNASFASSKTKQNEANEAESVNDSVNVNDSVSVCGCVNDSVNDCESDCESDLTTNPLDPAFNYNAVIFSLVKSLNEKSRHKLPVNYNQFAFESKEAREFLEVTRGLHSNEQLQTVKNLFEVLNLDNPRYYPRSWQQFCRQVPEYLPGNFDISRYRQKDGGKPSGGEEKKLIEQKKMLGLL
ncbi:MAG: hypothetical protein MJ196_06015 [Treponemataceae bacterium]|nr:hypothetical protein [Treponemataceae bacterium]